MTEAQSTQVASFVVVGLGDWLSINEQDLAVSEIKMIDTTTMPHEALQDAMIGEGLARVLGFSSCVFASPGCAVRSTKELRIGIVTEEISNH